MAELETVDQTQEYELENFSNRNYKFKCFIFSVEKKNFSGMELVRVCGIWSLPVVCVRNRPVLLGILKP